MKEPLKFVLNNTETIFYFLLLLFLPTQFGKHFWPLDAFVLGQRIDYLSPTIYTTDILVTLLLLTFIIRWSFPTAFKMYDVRCRKFKNRNELFGQKFHKEQSDQRNRLFSFSHLLVFVILVVLLFLNIFFSQDHIEAIYGWIKLGEIAFLTWYTSIVLKKQFQIITFALAFGIIFESILAILEFFHQRSINGIFYYFGERLFSSTTPGIANASINGQLIMRPYATFSHPNVLAAYLVIGMIFLIGGLKIHDVRFKNVIAGLSLVIGTIALFLTLSRTAIICWIFIFCLLLIRQYWRRMQNTKYLILNTVFALGMMSLVVLTPVLPRFTGLTLSDESIVLRVQLSLDAFRMLFEHPLFGVGMNNFLIALPHYIAYGQESDFKPFLTLQPVHNIFLLIAVETGFVGFWLTVSFVLWLYLRLYKTFIQPQNKNTIFSLLSIILITTVIVLGCFDHYFLTLQQGQLLLAIVLGFVLATIQNSKASTQLLNT